MEELVRKVIAWGEEKGILENSTPGKQFLKTMEEVGELASAIGKNDLEGIKDAIGDIVVALILHMELMDIGAEVDTFGDCYISEYYNFAELIEAISKIGFYRAGDSLAAHHSYYYSYELLEIIGEKYGLSIEECLQSAYDRKVTNV